MDKGRAYERRAAKRYNLSVVTGSGAVWNKPGDCISKNKNFLIECKKTDKQQFPLKTGVIEKIRQQSAETGKEWAILIEIGDVEVLVCDPNFLEFLDENINNQ